MTRRQVPFLIVIFLSLLTALSGGWYIYEAHHEDRVHTELATAEGNILATQAQYVRDSDNLRTLQRELSSVKMAPMGPKETNLLREISQSEKSSGATVSAITFGTTQSNPLNSSQSKAISVVPGTNDLLVDIHVTGPSQAILDFVDYLQSNIRLSVLQTAEVSYQSSPPFLDVKMDFPYLS
jgi:hypothetical protein